ncbi:VOC family protein [Paenibacillus eucommiae]|uniref:Enzyme related to lactoylglutathione lyase n=1 Tax=Paenibacillus eucommiae TaxID=1355755 RepID=A0ABS4IQ84_9BACL|nr:VOC family protein [Paenibacillus eucommiae]MBP1989668.1 putative enzyme related to lactoylglutathione lyase [Paenibacillus eucommiae]
MSEEKTDAKLLEVKAMYLPAKDPYETATFYCEVFDLDPDASEQFPLKRKGNKIILYTKEGFEFIFLKSNDIMPLSFHNTEGNHHSVMFFQVTDLFLIYNRIKEKGLKIEGDEIVDRGSCGTEFAFYDPDGRRIDVSNWGTDTYKVSATEPKLIDASTLYLPAKNPYETAKFYCEVFDLDPNSSTHSKLKEGAGMVVLKTKYQFAFFFIISDDIMRTDFNTREHNQPAIQFQVNEIESILGKMEGRDVKIDNKVLDHEQLQRFSFYDPDFRKVEIIAVEDNENSNLKSHTTRS